MVWAHFDNKTQQWTYTSGTSPYAAVGPGGKQIAHEGGSHYTYSDGGRTRWDWVADPRTAATATAPPPDASVVTGIDPSEIHNALYGKVIPLSTLGLARIGLAGLIFGPYFNSGLASFAVSFGFPTNLTGTRRVYEVSLDSKVTWELTAGSPDGQLDAAGFLGTPFTCRFYSGTQTQPADPLEAGMFGAEAVAYRPQMMLWFENLPVAQFDGKIPFVSAKIGDTTDAAVPADGLNLGTVLERIAYSPWLEYTPSTFETTGVADIVQSMILTEDQSFLNLLRVTARIYRSLNILQTDMLRVNDRGSIVTPDLSLHRDHISAEAGVQYIRQEEASVARELELITIDPDADYVFMPYKVARPRSPVPVTSSVGKDTVTLPVTIAASTRAAMTTFAKYQEENARRRVSLQTLAYGYELEPGDLFTLNVADGFDPGEIWKVVETSHGANYINEIVGEAILACAIDFEPGIDPYFSDVILLLHANVAPAIDSSQYAEPMDTQGGVVFDTSAKVFGASSFRFDAYGDLVCTMASLQAWWSISPTNTSPYTIELWARPTEIGAARHQTLICRNAGVIGRYWHLFIPSETDEVQYQGSNDGFTWSHIITTSDANLVNATWYHIAVDKSSTGKIRIYVNGVMRGSDTPANSVLNSGLSSIDVGGSSSAINFKGNIDEVRITKRSRYGDIYGDSSFAVPTAEFPDET